MRKRIEHIIINTSMDTLCGYDTQLLDNEGVPHKPQCDCKERDVEDRPIEEGYEYEKICKKYKSGAVICKKCVEILRDYNKQFLDIIK